VYTVAEDVDRLLASLYRAKDRFGA
jgi:hypothetical protein